MPTSWNSSPALLLCRLMFQTHRHLKNSWSLLWLLGALLYATTRSKRHRLARPLVVSPKPRARSTQRRNRRSEHQRMQSAGQSRWSMLRLPPRPKGEAKLSQTDSNEHALPHEGRRLRETSHCRSTPPSLAMDANEQNRPAPTGTHQHGQQAALGRFLTINTRSTLAQDLRPEDLCPQPRP